MAPRAWPVKAEDEVLETIFLAINQSPFLKWEA